MEIDQSGEDQDLGRDSNISIRILSRSYDRVACLSSLTQRNVWCNEREKSYERGCQMEQ